MSAHDGQKRSSSDVHAEFQAFLADHDEELPLDLACLHIAKAERPGARVEESRHRLDELAKALEQSFPFEGDLVSKLVSLADFLFVKENYRGNNEDYYELRNSYLDDVLDRRRGIPITLSVLAIEVARRVGFELVGVGFPGHFLVTTAEHTGFYLDGFRGGQLLQREECRELLEHLSGGNVAMKSSDLQPVSHRQIAARVLQNIKGIHLRQGRLTEAVRSVERILLLFPDATGLLRERGLLYLQLGAFRFAVQDLRSYLEGAADPPDREAIEAALLRAEQKARLLV